MEEASGIKRSIYDQLLTRLRHQNAFNRCLIVSSNPDMNWIKDVLVENEARANPLHPESEDYDPTIKHWIWPTALNKYLPPDFADKLKKNRPEWWIQRFLMGSFNHSSGLVYPEVSSAIIEDIPDFEEKVKSWEHVIGADFGIRNPTAVLIGAIDPDEGVLYMYKMYYRADALLPEHAKAIKPMVNAIPAGRIRFMVGDPAMRNRSADVVNGKSVQALYQEYNLYFSEGNNRMEAGLMRVNSYINRGKLKIFRTACAPLVREITNYKYPELSMDETKNLDENPIKYNDHACLTGDTLVRTSEGDKAISQIVVGDFVLTRQGFKKVYNAACTGFNKDLVRVHLSNGTYIDATPDHNVWVQDKGYISLDALRYGDILEASPDWEEITCHPLSITEDAINSNPAQGTTGEQSRSTVKKLQSTFTAGYGKIISDLYRKDSTSIIKTKINRITTLKTWSAFLTKYTFPTTRKDRVLNTWRVSGNLLQSGTVLKKVGRGTLSTVKEWLRTCRNVLTSVNSAVKPTLRNRSELASSAPISASLHGEDLQEWTTLQKNVRFAEQSSQKISTAKPKPAHVRVVDVHSLEQKQDVYNIAVEDAHEFYANGVLVRNCDALRYLCMRLPEDPDMLQAMSFESPARYSDDEDEDEDEYVKDYLSYV